MLFSCHDNPTMDGSYHENGLSLFYESETEEKSYQNFQLNFVKLIQKKVNRKCFLLQISLAIFIPFQYYFRPGIY
jgi:hypothetical protein